MLQIYKDDKDLWHSVQELGKSGFAGVAITSHCGEGDGGSSITQVPDNWIVRVCKKCQEAVAKMEAQIEG